MDEEHRSDEANVEAGWEMRHDEASGQVYYWNSITGETSWDPPPNGSVVHPWTQTFDEEGRIYYLNTETMETRWTPPDNTDIGVLSVTGGRGRRPSTAEQMTELNRLLSGGGDDGEEEVDDANASSSSIQVKPATETQCPWMMFINEGDGVPYYYNSTTSECLWEPPEEFLRFQQTKQLENTAESTTAVSETDNSATTASLDRAEAKAEPVNSTAKNELAENVTTQVVTTPEFEEKIRQAVAAVTNTPVSSSRLVLVQTPTQLQLAPQTGRSAGSTLAHNTANSAGFRRDPTSRPSSASSRPSSSEAVTRTQMSSRLVEEEKITTNATKGVSQIGDSEVPQDVTRVSNEHDDEAELPRNIPAYKEEKNDIDVEEHILHDIPGTREEKTGIEKDGEENPHDAPVSKEDKIGVDNARNADNMEENNVAVVTSKFNEDTVEGETTVEVAQNESVESEGDIHLDEANDAGTGFQDSTKNMYSDADETTKDEPVTRTSDLLDTTSLEQNIHAAALVIQCLVRCFIARKRVKHKREVRRNTNQINIKSPLGSDTIITATDLLAQEFEKEEEPYRNDTVKHSQVEDVQSNDESPASLPDAPNQDSPHISARSAVESGVNVAETLPTPHSTLLSLQNSVTAPIHKQYPRRDQTSVSTRLPSVLDITTYFPQRTSAISSRISNSTNITELVAITRKKVDMIPPRIRRTSQQETQVEHENLKNEDERAQHAEVIEYQRIYAESRKKFEAEKQRLFDEKNARDNHCDHDAEEKKRARVNAQREREAVRAFYKTVDDKADRLVWEYMNPQGRPEQSVNHFRDALTHALDSTYFPTYMCAERARELNERIKRLRQASWEVDSQLEDVELRLISELHPLTSRQRLLQAKYAARLRCRLEKMLNTVQSWQYVINERESEMENDSIHKYWSDIQAHYVSSSTIYSSGESRRHYVLNEWRGAAGGDSLLHIAAWNGLEEHVRLLLEEGSDVNLVDCSASHKTPLHEACRAGHAPVVEQLLRSGARLNAVDVSGDSPLHVACRGGWTRVVRILLMAANGLGEESDDQTPQTLTGFFNLRNGKGKHAIEVVTLPSLVAELHSKLCLLSSNCYSLTCLLRVICRLRPPIECRQSAQRSEAQEVVNFNVCRH
ncbi:hypothetical protein PHMEG_00010537 [Phytophthora megakarya]|uniref:WW domain-containing protein n=1 Tax=Phytophthora megakarya TaxID=4795 RepID=A0A225WFG3_9STRA|nr:hypothetical protein PHMEG_00010537 [Phytophthora megakarya]